MAGRFDNVDYEKMLIFISPQVVDLIVKNYNMSEIDALISYMSSDLYAALEREETKMWHLSPLMLYTLYDEEMRTGKITFPEEA